MGIIFSRNKPKILTPKLINANLLHKKYPETFKVPTIKEFAEINIGDLVKVNNNNLEYLWIKLESISNKSMIGQITNDLHKNSDYIRGDLIYLKYENIYRISKQKISKYDRH